MEYIEVKTCALFRDGWVPLQILTDKAQEETCRPARCLRPSPSHAEGASDHLSRA